MVMKKIFLIFILFCTLFGEINSDLLLIEAKLYPKIIMLTDNFYNKKKIKIAIIANENSLDEAREFKNFIQNPKFDIKIIKKINFNYDVYILSYDINDKIFKQLIKHKKVIFSLDPNLINKSMFSVFIGPRIYPLINPYLIKKANIKVNSIIFKVAKIYEN